MLNENNQKLSYQTLLALDTAMNGCGVGLRTSCGDVWVDQERMVRGQAEQLMPMVNDLMSKAGILPEDLQGIIVTLGPGTFTGLRLGISVAKVMAASLCIPAYGVTTLEVLAHETLEEGNRAIALETKRKDFYVQCFGEGKNPLTEAAALNEEDLMKCMKEHHISKVFGDAHARLKNVTEKLNMTTIDMASPKAMLEMGGDMIKDNKEPMPLRPVYLRPADVSVSSKKIRRIESL